ncbi:hypothetical protein [Rhodopirellula baltica]|nr:hypothetical protein [Rhodopirellula baltica]
MTVPKPPDDAKVLGSESGDQAATPMTPSAASTVDPLDELIDLIARLAALRRLRDAKESLTTEPTQELKPQPKHELENP